jgi:hypothetical protein
MDSLNFILGCFTLAGVLGTVAASFYGVRQKTTITILSESNKAYVERNSQLDEDIKRKDILISQQHERIVTLERIKTPPLEPLIHMVKSYHSDTIAHIEGNCSGHGTRTTP